MRILPPEWNEVQLITDMYATLRDATRREIDRLPDFLTLDAEDKDTLYEMWTHFHAAAFLMSSFAIVENSWGRTPWKEYRSLPQDEFEVLVCIRNAVAHTGGDLSRLRDNNCLDKVGRFRQKMKSELVWSLVPRSPNSWGMGQAMVLDIYYRLDGSHVILQPEAFDRVLMLMQGLCIETEAPTHESGRFPGRIHAPSLNVQ